MLTLATGARNMKSQSDEFRRSLVLLLPRLRRFARALTGGSDAAQDLVQSSVERALVHGAAYDTARPLDSWMFKLMQNLWIDTRRVAAAQAAIPLDDFDPFGEDGRDIVESRDELRAVRTAFAALPNEQRAVMALVVLEGLSYSEAAEVLEVPIGTIMSRLARARASVAATVRGPATMAPVRKQSDA